MKIWCQSCGAFGKDPIWDDYERGLKARAEKVARAETVVELHGLARTVPGIDKFRASKNICTIQSIQNAIRAEREGYDAFVMISMIDAGFSEIREMVEIPVVFALENCLHLSMMFAPQFAFLTHNKEHLTRLTELTKHYVLAERMVEGGHLDLSYMDWPEIFGHPERCIDTIVQKARELIEKGAGILIPSALPLGIWLIQQNLLEVDGTPILDAFGCAVKMAELMVEFRKFDIIRAKSGPRDKAMLEAMQQAYLDLN